MDKANPPCLSDKLTENQLELAKILVENNRLDLYSRISKFQDGKAQVEFFDQVKRRYLPLKRNQEDLPAYIRKEGPGTVESYIGIVEQLLAENPYDGFSPTPDLIFGRQIQNYLRSLKSYLAHYTNSSVVLEHVSKLHTAYPHLQSSIVDNLLQFSGNIYYKNGKDCGRDILVESSIFIRLPLSYPKRPPHVWIKSPDNMAVPVEHLNVAPNGLVCIPYLVNWVEEKSDLVTLVSHLRVDFTSQRPLFNINLGIQLSDEQTKLVKILIDYNQMHLYAVIDGLTPDKKMSFFNEVIQRCRRSFSSQVDLAHHIRTTKGALVEYVNIVAILLDVPPKQKGHEDAANLDFT